VETEDYLADHSMSEVRNRNRKGGGSMDSGSGGPTTAKSSEDTVREGMNLLSESVPASIKPYISQAIPYVVKGVSCCEAMVPLAHVGYLRLCEAYVLVEPYRLDLLIPAFMGLVMCFFGGSFMTLIAAIEAYRMVGWEHQMLLFRTLSEDFQKFAVASRQDDQLDLNNDGIADVQQISGRELTQRKTLLFLKTVDPKRVTDCIAGMQAGFLAVIATLKLEFAKAITLGNAIGHVAEKPTQTFIVPVFQSLLPADYQRWAEPLTGYVVKGCIIGIAWFIQRIISACHSAIRGGTMCARNVLEYLDRMNYVHIRAEETMIDEIDGYALAAVGLWFQLSSGFTLPFPLNVFMLPLTICEWFLMWCVNS